MKSKPIPTFIVEEHHEAFIVWNYAIQQGMIPSTGNTLFHVDEHSDMGTPRFNHSINNLNGNIEDIKEFTYKELGIASFIMPAAYKEIFSEVFWIRQKHRDLKGREERMYIRSYNEEGKRLVSGKIKDLKDPKPHKDRKEFDYFLKTIEQLPDNREVVLDIDLDYFSCSGNPNELEEIYLEITKEEYDSFISNKYHRLNYSGIGKIEAQVRDGNFYYIINNYNEIYPTELKVGEKIIKERIKNFVSILNDKNVIPVIITICRSKYSGYTPNDQWKFIEDELSKKLSSIFRTEVKTIL